MHAAIAKVLPEIIYIYTQTQISVPLLAPPGYSKRWGHKPYTTNRSAILLLYRYVLVLPTHDRGATTRTYIYMRMRLMLRQTYHFYVGNVPCPCARTNTKSICASHSRSTERRAIYLLSTSGLRPPAESVHSTQDIVFDLNTAGIYIQAAYNNIIVSE